MNYLTIVILIAFGVFWGINMYKHKETHSGNDFTWENQKKMSDEYRKKHNNNDRQ